MSSEYICISIFQTNKNGVVFYDSEHMKKSDILTIENKIDFEKNGYKKVLELSFLNNDEWKDQEILEDIYISLNQDFKPADFIGHSLSVSDIITIEDRHYMCDCIGFTRVYKADQQRSKKIMDKYQER